MTSLGDEFPKEVARVRMLLREYKDIGAAGQLAASMINLTLIKADDAIVNGDVVAMIEVFEELRGIK